MVDSIKHPTYAVGVFTNTVRGINNSFSDAELAIARETGVYAFTAKMRGWNVKQLDADFNAKSRTFRTLIHTNEGRRIIAANLANLTPKQLDNALKAGKLDMIASAGGTQAKSWVRFALKGYRAGTGWTHTPRVVAVASETPKRSKRTSASAKSTGATATAERAARIARKTDDGKVVKQMFGGDFPAGFLQDFAKDGLVKALQAQSASKLAREYEPVVAAGDINFNGIVIPA